MDNEFGAAGIIGLLLLLLGLGKKKEEITPVVIIPPEDEGNTDVPSRTDDGKPEKKDEGPPLPEIIDTYPRPAAFYQVKFGDTGLGIAKRYVRSAAYLAATEIGGLDTQAANAWATGVSNRNALQVRAWRFFSCSGWNDALYTTYGWKAKSLAVAPTGRSIRLLPQNPNNHQRLAAGATPQRGMKMLKPADKGKGGGLGVGGHRSFEFLWLPGIDLKRLWDSDGNDMQPGGGDWGNSGVSKMNPPPWVRKLGVEQLPGAQPQLGAYGCDGMQWSPKGG